MEVDVGGSAADMAAGGGGGGGCGSEVEKNSVPEGGEPKLKRKMKTASQLEILEKTYASETYPSEALRAELSLKLGLSDRQLQMWFCHRRLKDRKAPAEKRCRKEASPGNVARLSSGVGDEITIGHSSELGNEHGLHLSSGSSALRNVEIQEQHRVVHRAGTALARIGTEMPAVKRYYEPPQALSELRAIAFVEAQLGERLREDGPILGMEFDQLPPGAFGAPIVAVGQQKPCSQLYEAPVYERPDAKVIKGATRLVHEYQFLPEEPSVRDDNHERSAASRFFGPSSDDQSSRTALFSGSSLVLDAKQLTPGDSFHSQMSGLSIMPQLGKQSHQSSPTSAELEIAPQRTSFVNVAVDGHHGPRVMGIETPFISSDRRVTRVDERLERKRKSEEARLAREVEAHEKRIRKELEKQDILKRKREEQMKKEMERQYKERRKEEERLLREKLREEERYQREQRREMERQEKFIQKESIRAEKMRLKEEMRREKEAARLKAANDRAIARRIAKESIELIDDERLELMELAASIQGLPSVLALDNEALQNLGSLRDRLTDFPPRTVHLKRPFGIQPWTDSEDSVGSLLMVWKFLITFADVLGLWPFTLDEFVQAFHDYDARLLGEIHIALLKTIIKDIEDVARTPASAMGTNQNNAGNPGGGHPQIVEGAYAWGFDIRSWQQHLNPLTWPEILRQFALSAGFGPKLKKKSTEQAYFPDENEGKDGANIISDLKNGAAAENAVAKMRRRGITNLRRSRHLLTPGTVKFAAFHVLSLEGSKGLTILEVAEKIQKSGLRDLTTSKTPEASIAAALSRDTKLFERTAPSTYCVRTPYRKDPADAESILSAALEKVQVYKNGCLHGEADEAEKEDVERDEDSESDVVEDADVDDLDTETKPDKETLRSFESEKYEAKVCCGNGMNSQSELMEIPLNKNEHTNSSSDIAKPESFLEMEGTGTPVDRSTGAVEVNLEATYPDQEDTVIDGTNHGELWVQGLAEGEYSDLSVEERLDALVALINVANEGNSVRLILEERLEAANALKKQMWAEAQLDKRRVKEEYAPKMQYSSFSGNRFDLNSGDGRQNPFLSVDGVDELASSNPENQQEDFGDSQRIPNYSNNMTAERSTQPQDFSTPDNLLLQQSAYAAEKSRSEIKAYIGHRAEEIYVYKSLPLGQDRRRNRYWQFMASASQHDPGSGRIFVELHDGQWRVIDTTEAFDALMASLDVRGFRESHLHLMLQKIELPFKEIAKKKDLCSNSGSQDGDNVKKEDSKGSPKSSRCVSNPDITEPLFSCSIDLGSNGRDKYDSLKRYHRFEKWIWEECFNSITLCALRHGKTRRKRLLSVCDYCQDLYFLEDNHCPFCYRNYSISYNNSSFSEHTTYCQHKVGEMHDRASCKLEFLAPSRIRLLKVQLASVEASVSPEALQDFWTEDYRKSWTLKLQAVSSAEELLKILTSLEGAIKRDFLVPNYETTSELMGSSSLTGGTANNAPSLGMIAVLPWIPQTTSAVALRLLEFDTSICYTLHQKDNAQREKGSRNIIRIPARNTVIKNGAEDICTEHPREAGNVPEDTWVQSGRMRNSSGQGRFRGQGGGGIRVGRSQRSVAISRRESVTGVTTTNNDRFGPLLGWKGRARGRGGRKRVRRTVKSRQKQVKRAAEIAGQRASASANAYEKAPSSCQLEWNEDETVQAEAGDVSSSDISGFDDDKGQATGNDYDDLVVEKYSDVFTGKSEHSVKGLDYVTGEEDINVAYDDEEVGEEGKDGEDDEQEEDDVEEYLNGNLEDKRNKFINEEQMQMRDLNKGLGLSSSDYSD